MNKQQWCVAGAAFALVTACAQTAKQEDAKPTPAMAEAETASLMVRQAAPAMAADMAMAQTRKMQAERFHGGVMPGHYPAPPEQQRENYAELKDHGVLRAAEQPVSTFSIDVDTAAYANVRRFLRQGSLPVQDAVRVEELINYFDYGYAPPKDRAQPFSVHTEIAPTPWNAKTHLLRVGLQGWKPSGPLPASNLVFLVDVSGSMHSPDKLQLVVSSLKLLVQQLGPNDRISLVTYAGQSGVVLEPTAASERVTIMSALDRLQAGGSTAGASGIELAYAMARQGFIEGGINRVLLATDGDFNVGITDFEQLMDMVERERRDGVALSTLGFGTGNYNDHLMEQLANRGNGNYHYIDGLEEARRALVVSRTSTLMTIASDVKIQVEFNPAVVAEYRLIGYENRALAREDFNNDQVDAGEIGAGHNVTALYEIALVGSGGERIDDLRYGRKAADAASLAELAHLRLRYKQPGESVSRLIEQPIGGDQVKARLADASESFRFAAAVAAFGQNLRGGRYTEGFDNAALLALAKAARGDDAEGWLAEFLQLVQLADSLALPARAGTDQTGECVAKSGCG
jgi:Ca-activated chloride channel homolog